MNLPSLPRVAGCVALAGVLMLSAACGGDDKGDGSDAFTKFQDCLKKNGVTMPQGGQRPSGRPTGRPSGAPSGRPSGRPSGMPSFRPSQSPEQQKAMQACASLRPQGGGPGNGGQGRWQGGPGNGGQPGNGQPGDGSQPGNGG